MEVREFTPIYIPYLGRVTTPYPPPPLPPRPEVEPPLTKEKEKELRGTFGVIGGLLLEGFSFGLYNPHFTEEEKKANPLFFKSLEINEKISENHPFLGKVVSALLPYDLSLATALQSLSLVGGLKVFTKVGRTLLNTTRLAKPLDRATASAVSGIVRTFRPTISPEKLATISGRYGERIANDIALGWGVGLGESIKTLITEKDVPKAFTNFAVHGVISSILFPGVSLAFEPISWAARPLMGRIWGVGKVAEIPEIKMKSPGVELLDKSLKRNTDTGFYNTIQNIKDGSVKELEEGIKKKLGLDKINLLEIQRLEDIVNPVLRNFVEEYRKTRFLSKSLHPTVREEVIKIATAIDSVVERNVNSGIRYVDEVLNRFKQTRFWKEVVPPEMRFKNIGDLTVDERNQVLEHINLALKEGRIEIRDLDLDRFFAENRNLMEMIADTERKAAASVIAKMLQDMPPKQIIQMSKGVLAELEKTKVQAENLFLKDFYEKLTPELREAFERGEEEISQKFREELAKKLMGILPSYLARQRKILFSLDDRGENVLTFLENIGETTLKRDYVGFLNEKVRNLSATELSEKQRKFYDLLKNPLRRLTEKIDDGTLNEFYLPETATPDKVKETIEAKLKNPAEFIKERLTFKGDNYDAWLLAADAYEFIGLNREDIAQVWLKSQRNFTFDRNDLTHLKRANDYLVGLFPVVGKLVKGVKDPYARLLTIRRKMADLNLANRLDTEIVIPKGEFAAETLTSAKNIKETITDDVIEKTIETSFPDDIKNRIDFHLLKSFLGFPNKESFIRKMREKAEKEGIYIEDMFEGPLVLGEIFKVGDKFKYYSMTDNKIIPKVEIIGEETKGGQIFYRIKWFEEGVKREATPTEGTLRFGRLIADYEPPGKDEIERFFNLLNSQYKNNPIAETLIKNTKDLTSEERIAAIGSLKNQLFESFRHSRRGEKLAEILTELETAEAGKRFRVDTDENVWIGQPSTFPDWIPPELRKKDVLNDTLKYLTGEILDIPKKKDSQRLFWIIMKELDKRSETDTSTIWEVLSAFF